MPKTFEVLSDCLNIIIISFFAPKPPSTLSYQQPIPLATNLIMPAGVKLLQSTRSSAPHNYHSRDFFSNIRRQRLRVIASPRNLEIFHSKVTVLFDI